MHQRFTNDWSAAIWVFGRWTGRQPPYIIKTYNRQMAGDKKPTCGTLIKAALLRNYSETEEGVQNLAGQWVS